MVSNWSVLMDNLHSLTVFRRSGRLSLGWSIHTLLLQETGSPNFSSALVTDWWAVEQEIIPRRHRLRIILKIVHEMQLQIIVSAMECCLHPLYILCAKFLPLLLFDASLRSLNKGRMSAYEILRLLNKARMSSYDILRLLNKGRMSAHEILRLLNKGRMSAYEILRRLNKGRMSDHEIWVSYSLCNIIASACSWQPGTGVRVLFMFHS